ncbi:MAG: exodeoxyribonuclease VII large subunit [Bacteroidetes bacterium CG_4_10_14_3_um_filter_31_20]|nr:MAG: exodeoxyribonuclease VII large subunit [Bacteroidetes bacterium CG_4_10_14_3_um_filter_31_20]
MSQEFLSLFQLNGLVKKALKENFSKTYWIVAEISEIRNNSSGHCYLEFIQKDEASNNILAKARANIWASTYRLIKPYFETSTNSTLSQGMKILVNVSVEFHELYGYSLTIHDIDPAYTIGDMEQKRTLTIQQLVADGIFDMNRQLEMPVVPQRIAVISSETAAGYGDFRAQLENNEYGFVFYPVLFQAYMQGDSAESSILNALDNIYTHNENFDVVVIIRGGGSRAELSCFDSYDLASNICQFPLPVIAGIGHERDQSVVDMIANTRVKTPTAAATFLIAQVSEFAFKIDEITETIVSHAKALVENCGSEIELVSERINFLSSNLIHTKNESLYKLCYLYSIGSSKKLTIYKTELNNIEEKLKYSCNDLIKINEQKIESYQRIVNQCEPDKVLKKGFSITTFKGKQIKNINILADGDNIDTQLHNGTLKSVVKK